MLNLAWLNIHHISDIMALLVKTQAIVPLFFSQAETGMIIK